MESGVGWSVLCWCFWNKYGLNHGEEVFTFNVVGKIFYKLFALLMQFAKIMSQQILFLFNTEKVQSY